MMSRICRCWLKFDKLIGHDLWMAATMFASPSLNSIMHLFNKPWLSLQQQKYFIISSKNLPNQPELYTKALMIKVLEFIQFKVLENPVLVLQRHENIKYSFILASLLLNLYQLIKKSSRNCQVLI